MCIHTGYSLLHILGINLQKHISRLNSASQLYVAFHDFTVHLKSQLAFVASSHFASISVALGLFFSAHHQRSDVCAVPAAGVVAEAMVALVLAEAALEKFGGDSLAETRRNHRAYLDRLAERGLG